MNRNKFIITGLLVLSILAASLLSGCSNKSNSTATPSRKCQIVKVNEVYSKDTDSNWKIYQLRLTLEKGARFTIDLNLNAGDKVDCWYKIEKPSSNGSIDFQVKAGTVQIYTSSTAASTVTGNASDLLSFDAAQAYGTSYRLIFYNDSTIEDANETIFVEITYPSSESADDSIFIPLETD